MLRMHHIVALNSLLLESLVWLPAHTWVNAGILWMSIGQLHHTLNSLALPHTLRGRQKKMHQQPVFSVYLFIYFGEGLFYLLEGHFCVLCPPGLRVTWVHGNKKTNQKSRWWGKYFGKCKWRCGRQEGEGKNVSQRIKSKFQSGTF